MNKKDLENYKDILKEIELLIDTDVDLQHSRKLAEEVVKSVIKRYKKLEKKQERMTFVQDDDSHWYLIPAEKIKLFHELNESVGKYWDVSDGEIRKELENDIDLWEKEFGDATCEYPNSYSFIDLKKI